jgi:hypothetical protein
MMKVLKVQLGEEVRFQPLCRRRSASLAAPDIDALALKRRESGSGVHDQRRDGSSQGHGHNALSTSRMTSKDLARSTVSGK